MTLEGQVPKVIFIKEDGTENVVNAPIGLSILEIAHRNSIDLEGACEGSMACSTCHIIVDEEFYELLTDPCEEEEDMLDLAFGLTATSRLGCQIIMSEDLDGIKVKIPSVTRNINL
jgi:2Fe-2S ferredoxin